MDVIKITPEELRQAAGALEVIADQNRYKAIAYFENLADRQVKTAGNLYLLADKLEADKREALEFIPAKGVQA